MQTVAPLDQKTIFAIAAAFVLIVGAHWLGEKFLLLPLGLAIETPREEASTQPITDCDMNAEYTNLPDALQQPERVCNLNLSQKGIIELPPTVGNLTQLRILDLSHNQLTQLPEEIGWMRELKEFNLRNNKLTVLPPHIGWMRELKVLDVSNNQLTVIPDEVGWLQELERFDVRANPLPAEEIAKAQRYLPSTSIITQ